MGRRWALVEQDPAPDVNEKQVERIRREFPVMDVARVQELAEPEAGSDGRRFLQRDEELDRAFEAREGVSTVDLREYQLTAAQTSRLAHGGPHGAIAPMLGLASETGSILNVYKQYLRDGIDLDANRELLREELGDLLWYTATVATACGLNLAEIAATNLVRTRDLYATPDIEQDMTSLPVLDAGFPATERFPRRLVIEFEQQDHPDGRAIAVMTVIDAAPNAYPAGPLPTLDGKELGYTVGGPLGDPLSDSSRRVDAYRFHDAIHFGFMAVLGWSPNSRALLRIKRKSDPLTDACEDGARSIFAEERTRGSAGPPGEAAYGLPAGEQRRR